MTATSQNIEGPVAIQQRLVIARDQLKAELARTASASEREWQSDQIAVASIALRLPQEIGRGRDVICHGTRALPVMLRAGKLMPADMAEQAVFFSRSPEVAAYFACLMDEKEERSAAGVLNLGARCGGVTVSSLIGMIIFMIETSARNFRCHLVGVVSEANVSEHLGPPKRKYLPRGFASRPAPQRREFNKRHLASERKLVADGRAAGRRLLTSS
jgi:hypothetical protein